MLISGAADAQALAFTWTHIHITTHIRTLISGAAATRAIANPYTYIWAHVYNANLRGCGYSGAGFSIDTYIYIHIYLYANLGGCGYSGVGRAPHTCIHIYIVCMLIWGAAATRALASPCTYICSHIYSSCMLLSGAAAFLSAIYTYMYTCLNCLYAHLGGCGYSDAGLFIDT